MSDIFICYAKEDRAQAQRLYHDLRAEGFDVWLDVERLPPGAIWRDEIRKAIREADYVLVLFSKTSCSKRGFVQAEIKEALEVSKELPDSEIFLIPARLEECTIPWKLTSLQWVDLFPSYERGLEQIVSTLRSRSTVTFAVPVSAIDRLGDPQIKDAAWRILVFIPWYFQVLFGLIIAPKRFIGARNAPLQSNLTAAVEFMVISALPYSIFNALLPLNSRAVVYQAIGYFFISVLLVFASSWAIEMAWRVVGGRAPWMRYAITTSYFSGVTFLLGFINVMLAIGALKFLDKKVLLVLRDAAGGNIWPLLDSRLLENPAVIAALWILAIGHVFLLLWTFFFWGSYREMNSATRVASFCAWILASILVLPIGLGVALLQQAIFNFVDVTGKGV